MDIITENDYQKIIDLCYGYIRINDENKKLIAINGIILEIMKYCKARYNSKYYIELKGSPSDNMTHYLLPKTNIKLSGLLSRLTIDGNNSSLIELEKVRSNTLESVCQYLGHHRDIQPNMNIPIPIPSKNLNDYISDKWDVELINKRTNKEVCQILEAALYMQIFGLERLAMVKIASLIKGLSPEEIGRVLSSEETDNLPNHNNYNTTSLHQQSNYDADLDQAIKLSLMDNNLNAHGQWNCSACTFENAAINTFCQMCFTQKQ